MNHYLLPALSVAAALWASSAVAAEPLVLSMRDNPGDAPAVVTAVAISPDGSRVFAGGDDHTVRVWDANTGDRLATLRGHTDWVRAITLGKRGDSLASVGADHSVCCWEVSGSEVATPVKRLADEALLAVAAHPDGQRLAAAGFGSRLRLFDLSNAADTPQEFACPCDDTRAVAVSPDGRWLAAAGRNGVVRIWDFEASGGSLDLPTDARRVRALCFSPDGRTLAAAGDSPVIHLFRKNDDDSGFGGPDATSDQLLVRPGKIHSLAFVGELTLAAGDSLNGIRLWNSESLAATGALTGHTGTVAALACSEPARRLVSGSFDTTVRVWEIGDGAAAVTTASRTPAATR